VLQNGLPDLREDPHVVGLRGMYPPLVNLIESHSFDSTPRLYIGDTLKDFPLARNVQYSPQTYSFVAHLQCIVLALWNEGAERELRPSDIRDICGYGAYGNHQKLSLDPWGLVENSPNSKNRRLTKNGRLFVQGKGKIPKTILKDPATNLWVPDPESPLIDINLT